MIDLLKFCFHSLDDVASVLL
eukprot:SAG31_NODE_36218_length_315_cov_0.958333_1_plen_20_part_01